MPKSVFRAVSYRGAKPDAKLIRCLYILMFGACTQLLTLTAAAFAFFAGKQLDEAKHNGDERAERFGQLLTPVKAFLTDKGLEVAVLAQQVLRVWIRQGVGRRTNSARCPYRLYEGANGIQALDWLVAKCFRRWRQDLKELFDVLRTFDVDPGFQQPVEEALLGFSGSPIQWSLEAMKTPTCPVQYRPIPRHAGDDAVRMGLGRNGLQSGRRRVWYREETDRSFLLCALAASNHRFRAKHVG